MRNIAIILTALMLSSCAKPIVDIQSADSITRQEAVSQFAENASTTDVEQLIALLEGSQDNGVRASCANALGYARATNAVPALLSVLKAPEWRVRRSTARALGRIGDPRAIDPLIEVLNENMTDPNLSEGRRCAIDAFVNLKSEKVVPVLLHMLTHNPGRDESERIDYTTALLAALGEQGDERAIPILAKFLDDRAGSQAAGAIGKIVGVDFQGDPEPLILVGPSPAKAKAWLEQHPELLTSKKDRGR